MTEVALFPIPNCVVFPGSIFPLHVFEPRYRAMVKCCAETGLLLGVCHAEKVIHEGKQRQTLEEALNSNQATYKPVRIFSAGRCEIEEIYPDGRMRVSLHAYTRMQAIEEIQTLPFSIYRCDVYGDKSATENERQEANRLKDKVIHRLLALLSNVPELKTILQSDAFQAMDPGQFSFSLFQFLRFDSEIQQGVLECQSVQERMELILSVLNSVHN